MAEDRYILSVLNDTTSYWAVPLNSANLKLFFARKNREERFATIQEQISPFDLAELEEIAQAEELFEVVESIKEVRTSHLRSFTILFAYPAGVMHRGDVVSFAGKDGTKYYHIDYTLSTGQTGSILNLCLNEFGDWQSEWDSGDPFLFMPIGREIAKAEKLQHVIGQTEVIPWTVVHKNPEKGEKPLINEPGLG
jgi:hypothetical protein